MSAVRDHQKYITPHIFRHSRIIHLIQQGVGELIIKLIMWGFVDSRMFINSAHLTGADIDREICKLYGIEPTITRVTGDTGTEDLSTLLRDEQPNIPALST